MDNHTLILIKLKLALLKVLQYFLKSYNKKKLLLSTNNLKIIFVKKKQTSQF